jgi:hypothetical protein
MATVSTINLTVNLDDSEFVDSINARTLHMLSTYEIDLQVMAGNEVAESGLSVSLKIYNSDGSITINGTATDTDGKSTIAIADDDIDFSGEYTALIIINGSKAASFPLTILAEGSGVPIATVVDWNDVQSYENTATDGPVLPDGVTTEVAETTAKGQIKIGVISGVYDPTGSAASVASDLSDHEGETTGAHGGIVADDDPRLSDSREWTAETISQIEAETGTATTRRAFTALRVRQAIAAWWATISLAISDITGLSDALDDKLDADAQAADADPAGTALAAAFAAKANDNAVVKLTGDQNVNGLKTFLSRIISNEFRARTSDGLDVSKSDGTSLIRVAKDGTGKTGIAEGINTTASGSASHAEGVSTVSSGDYSHAEGVSTTASGARSHAQGLNTTASGNASHSEGSGTTASGDFSHAEGEGTLASGKASSATGTRARAIHAGSRVETDGQQSNLESTASNQKTERFSGGYRFLGGDAEFQGVVYAPPKLVSSAYTAQLDDSIHVTATATITDTASPVTGRGFRVLVVSGTATVGGVAYSTAGTVIVRVWDGSAWVSNVNFANPETILTDSDSKVPPSGAVVDYVGTQIPNINTLGTNIFATQSDNQVYLAAPADFDIDAKAYIDEIGLSGTEAFVIDDVIRMLKGQPSSNSLRAATWVTLSANRWANLEGMWIAPSRYNYGAGTAFGDLTTVNGLTASGTPVWSNDGFDLNGVDQRFAASGALVTSGQWSCLGIAKSDASKGPLVHQNTVSSNFRTTFLNVNDSKWSAFKRVDPTSYLVDSGNGSTSLSSVLAVQTATALNTYIAGNEVATATTALAATTILGTPFTIGGILTSTHFDGLVKLVGLWSEDVSVDYSEINANLNSLLGLGL